jgi:hypothetical protein
MIPVVIPPKGHPAVTTAEDRIVTALEPHAAARLVRDQIDTLANAVADTELMCQVADAMEGITHLSTEDTATRAEITARQLRYWTQQGWLVPDPRIGQGPGHPCTYPLNQVLKAKVMGSLVNVLKLDPAVASEAAPQIVELGSAHVGPYVVTKRGLGR